MTLSSMTFRTTPPTGFSLTPSMTHLCVCVCVCVCVRGEGVIALQCYVLRWLAYCLRYFMGFRLSSVTGQNSPSVGISSMVDVGEEDGTIAWIDRSVYLL